mmetsp:Transcript_13375/g.26198  ORF Transcript_13375/g.26198 Transcript_13375/m.26198 type:complete len:213 (-) Transcript_13375:165-803(-)
MASLDLYDSKGRKIHNAVLPNAEMISGKGELSHASVALVSITDVDVDAVVNAANETLEGGGGVDYAIHKAAGPQLLEFCKKVEVKRLTRSAIVETGRCDVGEVVATPAFSMKRCKCIFHTVAPILDSNGKPNDAHMELCYDNCLKTATEMKLKSIAFCSLGTGFYGFPKDRAAKLACKVATKYPGIKIVFTVTNKDEHGLYATNLLKNSKSP